MLVKNMIVYVDKNVKIWGAPIGDSDYDDSFNSLSKRQKEAWVEQLKLLRVNNGWTAHSYTLLF